MLDWALAFLVIALIAALFGFDLVPNTAMGAAKLLFFAVLLLFVVTLLAGALRRPAA